MALKWGIASTGNIAHDFVNAIGTLSKEDHQVVAVAASRDLSRSQDFAKRFDIPKAYGNYLELAQDPDVEIVHIGTLHVYHLEVALLMLDHGKHVLVETPMGMNEKQIRQLTSYAKQKKLFAMEGIWSRMFPSYQYIREQIDSGKLGEIVSIDVEFGFSGISDIPRMMYVIIQAYFFVRAIRSGKIHILFPLFSIERKKWAEVQLWNFVFISFSSANGYFKRNQNW